MKRIILGICCVFLLASPVFSQVEHKPEYTKIELSGFKVSLLYSETFSIQMDDSFPTEKNISGDTVTFIVTDQTGRWPKSSMIIRTNKLEYLSLHNCTLDMQAPFNVDSLEVIAGPSMGELKVNANYLSVNIGGGSRFVISGTTNYFDCAVGAGSSLNAAHLNAAKGEIDAMGHSGLTVNIREVIKQHIENAKVKNTYK